MGVLTGGVGSSGFTTPLLDIPSGESYLGNLDVERIRAELAEEERRQQQAQRVTSSTVRSDLDEAHRQQLPAGVDVSQPASSFPIGQPSGSSQPANMPAQQTDSSEEELIPADDTSGDTRPFQKAVNTGIMTLTKSDKIKMLPLKIYCFNFMREVSCLKTLNKE